jgi:hypothetical protein
MSKQENSFDGIEFLRALVKTYGWRSEHLNEGKTPIQLVNEFKKYLNDEIDLDGNKHEDEH